mgnify:FL=1
MLFYGWLTVSCLTAVFEKIGKEKLYLLKYLLYIGIIISVFFILSGMFLIIRWLICLLFRGNLTNFPDSFQ